MKISMEAKGRSSDLMWTTTKAGGRSSDLKKTMTEPEEALAT
jgi:hypothetical protein